MRDCMQFDAIRRMLFVDYAICAFGGLGDEAINESINACISHGSLVVSFSSEP